MTPARDPRPRDLRRRAQTAGGANFTLRDFQRWIEEAFPDFEQAADDLHLYARRCWEVIEANNRKASTFEDARLQLQLLAKEMWALIPGA
jgi:hypothetical protein